MDAALSVEEKEDSEGELVTKVDLVVIDIYTKMDDHYRFPAMSRSALATVLPKDSNRVTEASLTLVNASTTILMIPMRIVKEITVDGGTWWVSLV